jgi:alpha-L-fucosidase
LAAISPIVASRASAYGPIACSPLASITPQTLSAGGSFTLFISGNCQSDTFTVVLHSAPVTLGTVTTNAGASGSGTFTVPANTSGGDHTVTAADASGNSTSTTVVVTAVATATPAAPAAPAATSHQPLPLTGAQITGLVSGAVVAIGAGGLLVLATRRRKARYG